MRKFDYFVVPILMGAVASAILTYTGWGTKESKVEAPTQTTAHVWKKADSLAYARDRLEVFTNKQFVCLGALWSKESQWNPRAYNKERVMGKNAGGIPQLLGMSPATPPTIQIERGLAYIYFRYETPCRAWEHWKKKRWY